MTITTQDELLTGMAQSWNTSFVKSSVTGTLTARMISMWLTTGNPAAGAIPSTAEVPTLSTTGSFQFKLPDGAKQTYVARLSAVLSLRGSLFLMDRLIHSGGLVGNILTSQTVNTPALPGRGERSDGGDVEWFAEIYTSIGSSNPVVTVTYTDGITNTPGQTITYTHPSTTNSGKLIPIFPAAGQTIKSIESIQFASSAGSAGNFGIIACRRLVAMDLQQNQLNSYDALKCSLPRVYDTSCLFFVVSPNSFSDNTGELSGELILAQG